MSRLVPGEEPCAATLLRTFGPRLTKILRSDGTAVDYDRARWFVGDEVEVRGLPGLVALLARLQDRPTTCLVRGEIIDLAAADRMRRRSNGPEATLREVPRRWMAADFDSVAVADDFPREDLAACVRAVMPRLPFGFRDRSCVVQATSSHMRKPGLRLRLWFWLDRPMAGWELKRWLDGRGVDLALFSAVQPHYTAAPVFAGGADDPLAGGRLMAVRGPAGRLVATPAVVEDTRVRAVQEWRPWVEQGSGDALGRRRATMALASATMAIVAAEEGDRHHTARRWAGVLAGMVGDGNLAPGEMVGAIDSALQQAGKEAGEGIALAEWVLRQERQNRKGA